MKSYVLWSNDRSGGKNVESFARHLRVTVIQNSDTEGAL